MIRIRKEDYMRRKKHRAEVIRTLNEFLKRPSVETLSRLCNVLWAFGIYRDKEWLLRERILKNATPGQIARLLMDMLLNEIGLERRKCFITSVVKCFPPGNRPPKADEAVICVSNYLSKQIKLVNPKLVVLLGKVAQRYVPEHLLSGRIVLKTAHPAAGMRFPKIRRKMKRDFNLLKKLINEIS